MLAVQADGRRIETVESLGRANNLNPLQRAFWEMHGLQCGYCTPGMLMLMTELLREIQIPIGKRSGFASTTISAAAPAMRTSSTRSSAPSS
jgi:aerobic-type carbon monoxide dehydrogenase small subunit (CoxS/CutS family)